MFQALFAALTAFPKLLDLISNIRDDIGKLVAAFQRQQEEKWIRDNRELIFKVVRAKTDAERWILLRELVKLRDTMP